MVDGLAVRKEQPMAEHLAMQMVELLGTRLADLSARRSADLSAVGLDARTAGPKAHGKAGSRVAKTVEPMGPRKAAEKVVTSVVKPVARTVANSAQ